MTVPVALLDAPVNVAVSWTTVPAVTDVTGVPDAFLMTVPIVGAKKTAVVDKARSCDPVLAPSNEIRAV